jgi:LytTr DNA-binding domain
MIQRVRAFLYRPLAEDFSPKTQAWLSLQAGVYVFILLLLFGGNTGYNTPPLRLFGLFGLGCAFSSWVANAIVPRLFPQIYDEDNWTVGRHALHILLVLLFVTAGNQLTLVLLHLNGPPFLTMYLIVTAVGFFPISVGVMVAEQRRLKRNLAHAEQLNAQLNQLHQMVPATPAEPELPKGILLTGETGKERLSLLPNQLIYVESVGNYVEVHWLNFMFPQKTVLRSTLKDVEAALAEHPQCFRCHRAFLVNLRAVSHTTGNARGYQLTMSGSNRNIPVSRAYLAAFDARMKSLV